MPLVPFVLATLAGGGLWDLTLLYAGYSFGKNYDQVTTFVDDYKWYALGLAVLIAFAVIVVAVRRKKATPG